MTDLNDPIVPIQGPNLSSAWARALLKCHATPGGVLAPAIVQFPVRDNDRMVETAKVRQLLEHQLGALGIGSVRKQSPIETVAGTIFPQSVWLRCHGDRRLLYDWYKRMWPRVHKCPQNRNGVYFHRLIAFSDDWENGNQLEQILGAWEKGVRRRSALQAAIFNPLRDHRASRRLGFPCLQQVVFHPNGTHGKDGLSVVAFYANQLLLEKAYGNYLGLYRLGEFMAGEMGLRLKEVTCIATDLKLSDEFGKYQCQKLVQALEKELTYANE
jgi:hypothetical protein